MRNIHRSANLLGQVRGWNIIFPRRCPRNRNSCHDVNVATTNIATLAPCRMKRHQVHRAFASNASSSYSVDDCPHRTFAKTHPEAASRVLSVPPFSYQDFVGTSSSKHHASTSHPFSSSEVENVDGGGVESTQTLDNDNETLENYLQWRGWDIEGILLSLNNEYKLGDDLADSAIGLLSHPLTFPLTLGRHVKAFFSPPPENISHSDDYCDDDGDGQPTEKKRHLRICCVGARAECTLPDEFWKEFLIAALPERQAQSDDQHVGDDTDTTTIFHFTIDFVGPDVPSHLKSKTISLFDDKEEDDNYNDAGKYELTMNYHTSFLHEVVLKFLKSSHATNNSNSNNNNNANNNSNSGDGQSASNNRTEQIRQFWDGFALFNPGLGHPNLAKMWRPTLKFLVGTGKPILFTAHSTIDAKRDRRVLEGLLLAAGRDDDDDDDECEREYQSQSQIGLVQYEVNPYASRMGFVDPFSSPGHDDGVHVVRPNHSMFLLR